MSIHTVGVAYFLAIANFFVQSRGFVKFYDDLYAYWKCLPLLVLIAFASVHGGGMTVRTRVLLTIALALGCAGDYAIGIEHLGIVPGAVVFGLGHIFHMLTFAPATRSICWPLAGALLAWNAVVGHVCIMPILAVEPILSVAIMVIYSFTLTTTLVVAASQCMYGTTEQPAYAQGLKLRLLGYALFYLSDNTLIMDHTGFAVPIAEPIILSTYFAAQYFIVGAVVACERDQKTTKKTKAA